MIPMPRPSEVEPQPLPAGTAVGSFVLQRLLDRDEFSIRYVAAASASGGEVLIEEFAPAGISLRDAAGLLKPRSPAHAALWEEGLQVFLQESRLLARPLHPSLARVAALWEVRGTAFRMWPRFEGRTLAEVCATLTQPLSEDWLRDLVTPLLDALETMHNGGWVHGNVCPGQILVQPGGAPVLLDTAAVRMAIGARMPLPSTWPEPGFRPPELAQPTSEHVPGPWSDVYSLAAVARFCMDSSRTAAGSSPLSNAPHASRFVSALDLALAIDPRERPQTVAMFRQQLKATELPAAVQKPLNAANRRGLAGSAIPERMTPFPDPDLLGRRPEPAELEHDTALQRAWLEPVDSDPPWAREGARPPRARRWPWALAGLLAMLVGAVLATYQLTDDRPPPLAGMVPAMPLPEQLLARDPTAAGPAAATVAPTSPSTQPDPRPALPPTALPHSPTARVDPVVADPGRAESAALPPEQPERLAAMQPAAPATPVARREPLLEKPAAACAPRSNFALYRCMQTQCEQSRYYAHPQCVHLRRYDEVSN